MNKIKTFCIFVFLAAIIGSIAGQAAALTARSADIDIFVANISPNPVEPGNNIALNIILKNSGDEQSENTTAELKAAYPFTLNTVQNEVRDENICAGCSTVAIYTVSVDSSAKSGFYPVELEVSHGNGGARIIDRKAVNINVIGTSRITFKADVPSKVTPKSQFNVNFEFDNIGTGNARDIKVSTPSQSFVIAGGAPVIDSLQAGQSKNVTVSFISSPDIMPNVYSIPVSLSYVDELGNIKESSSNLGISVLGNSDLIIKNIKVEPASVSAGSEFTVTARVQNIGYGDAKEVAVELDAPYSGYKKAFIGKLGKDEDAPAIFSLAADAQSSDARLTIRYRDDFGEHEKTETIRINISGNSGIIYLYYAAAAVALIAVIYRKNILKAVGE